MRLAGSQQAQTSEPRYSLAFEFDLNTDAERTVHMDSVMQAESIDKLVEELRVLATNGDVR